jgi:hypothetical protein
MPDNIVISQLSPSSADLSSLCERRGVQRAQDLEAKLRREQGEEVDLDQVPYGSRDEGELWETADGQYALEHKLALLSWSGREYRPDMGYALLVGLGESA